MSDLSFEPQQLRFGSLTITYDSRVLVPRAWTQAQSWWAAGVLATQPAPRLLELCTGAGHIGLLAADQVAAQVVLVDIDPVACEYAERNARQVGSPVEVRCGAMSTVVAEGETFSVIVADPPWVPTGDMGRFPDDPVTAIDGGWDGLDLARECLRVIDAHLHPTGTAILQLGNADQVRMIDDWLTTQPLDLRIVEVRSHRPRGELVGLRRARTAGA